MSNRSGQSEQDRIEHTVTKRNDHEIVVSQDAVHNLGGRIIGLHDRQKTRKAIWYGFSESGFWRSKRSGESLVAQTIGAPFKSLKLRHTAVPPTNSRRTNSCQLDEILSKLAHLVLQTFHESNNTEFGGGVVGERVPAEQAEVRCDCNDVTCF